MTIFDVWQQKGACEGKVLHACSWHKAANGVELASASNGSQKGGIFSAEMAKKVEKDED